MCERKSWTKMEDRILKLLYQQRGFKKWSDVAQIMRTQYGILGRNGKQCRQRYHNHLDQKISKSVWTPLEDKQLLFLHNKLGNRWALIARQIKGRTDNCVKNRFYSRFRRSIKNVNSFIKIFWKKQFKQLKLTLISKIIEITQQYRISQQESKKEIFEVSQSIKCRLMTYSDLTENQLKQNQANLESLFQLIKQISLFNRKIKRKGKKKKTILDDVEDDQEEIFQNQKKPKVKRNRQKINIQNFQKQIPQQQSINLSSNKKQEDYVEQDISIQDQIQQDQQLILQKNQQIEELKENNTHIIIARQNMLTPNKINLQFRENPPVQLLIDNQLFNDEKIEDGFDINQFYQMQEIAYNHNADFF